MTVRCVRTTLFLALLALCGAVPAQAQRAMPFTKDVVTRTEYADAIRQNDKKVLNLDCKSMVTAFNNFFPDHDIERVKDCGELSSYFDTLAVKTCPQVETTVARVFPGKDHDSVDLTGYTRKLREGEECLYDNNAATWVASLSCGNFITGKLPYPVYEAERNEKVVEAKPAQPPAPAPPGITQAQIDEAARRLREEERRNGRLGDRDEGQGGEPPPDHSWFAFQRNGAWFWPVVAGSGFAVVCGMTHCFVNVEQSVRVSR